MIIDSKLNEKNHISYITGKIARGICVITKATTLLDKETLSTLYYTFIYPCMCYCNHSTETALVSVHDDILRAIDDKKCILLIMLDPSAAFDIVDHEILLRRLSCMLGISGSALQWFRSYLTDRKQKVVVNDVFSKSTSLTCGVPQGSVLGPILFTIYMLPLGEIIRSHGVQFHMYADDCQLYITCGSPDLNDSI